MIPVPSGVRVWLAAGHTDMPEKLDQVTSFPSKNIQIAGM